MRELTYFLSRETGGPPRPRFSHRTEFWKEDKPSKPHRGPAPLEDRDDADEKKKNARKYVEYQERGYTKQLAADFVGRPRSTLDRWVTRFFPEESSP